MIRWLKNSLRFGLVTVGIIFLTSFTIDATDTFRSSQTALGILADKVTTGECLVGMVRVDEGDSRFCIDQYEASPSSECLYQEPKNISETAFNINIQNCRAVSEKEQNPWTFVAWSQAEQLCAKSQKRLPTAEEWYQASLGTVDNETSCNLSGNLALTGSYTNCYSGIQAFDMVGNVWEFVDGVVDNGFYDGREIPSEGYVELIDESGVAVATTDLPNDIYNQDYFWSTNIGEMVLMRGGFYGSKSDGGIYATYAEGDRNFASAAIGFRCVQSLK